MPAWAGPARRPFVDPLPLFELSPYLYMWFMEPLGATDGSVEAAWDHLNDRWRDDVLSAAQALAPTMMRGGGIFADFYRWREGVGPRDQRPSMLNLSGWRRVQPGGHGEFVGFCRFVGAEPLICVNFESDGRRQYMKAKGSLRTGDAKEAAAWVAYCNDRECRSQGSWPRRPARRRPLADRERTSYDKNGFDLETAARKTVEFAKADAAAESRDRLVAWGDSGWGVGWLEAAGESAVPGVPSQVRSDSPRSPCCAANCTARSGGAGTG